MPMNSKPTQGGFTLIEALIVITITGIVAAVVAVFIVNPINSYYDATRRAELTDIADTAVRRMARDIQGALPNSVRVGGTNSYLEYLPVKAAGRYRADVGINPICPAGPPCDDPLDFTSTTDNSFDVLGPSVNIASGDSIVIYNLGNNIVPLDAYLNTNNRRVATVFGAALTNVTFSLTGGQFPFASPGGRFQVVNTPVSYVCLPNSGTPANGFLYRYSGYAIQAVQPVTIAALDALVAANPGVVIKAQLAGNVSACAVTYATGVQQSMGLVGIYLQLSKGGETVSLQHQVNVINTP